MSVTAETWTEVPQLSRPIYGWAMHDGFIVAKRHLLQIPRVPELLFFSLVQPVIFVLLFAFVFGGVVENPPRARRVQRHFAAFPGGGVCQWPCRLGRVVVFEVDASYLFRHPGGVRGDWARHDLGCHSTLARNRFRACKTPH